MKWSIRRSALVLGLSLGSVLGLASWVHADQGPGYRWSNHAGHGRSSARPVTSSAPVVSPSTMSYTPMVVPQYINPAPTHYANPGTVVQPGHGVQPGSVVQPGTVYWSTPATNRGRQPLILLPFRR